MFSNISRKPGAVVALGTLPLLLPSMQLDMRVQRTLDVKHFITVRARAFLQPLQLHPMKLEHVSKEIILTRKLSPAVRTNALEPRVLVVADVVDLPEMRQQTFLALEHFWAVFTRERFGWSLCVLVAEMEVVVM